MKYSVYFGWNMLLRSGRISRKDPVEDTCLELLNYKILFGLKHQKGLDCDVCRIYEFKLFLILILSYYTRDGKKQSN